LQLIGKRGGTPRGILIKCFFLGNKKEDNIVSSTTREKEWFSGQNSNEGGAGLYRITGFRYRKGWSEFVSLNGDREKPSIKRQRSSVSIGGGKREVW